MQKVVAVLLAIILLFFAVSCGKNQPMDLSSPKAASLKWPLEKSLAFTGGFDMCEQSGNKTCFYRTQCSFVEYLAYIEELERSSFVTDSFDSSYHTAAEFSADSDSVLSSLGQMTWSGVDSADCIITVTYTDPELFYLLTGEVKPYSLCVVIQK